MSKELATVSNNSPYAIMPVMELGEAVSRRKAIVEFTKRLMVDKVDYGTIPGAGQKATLFKAGAEKLCTLFGLSPFFDAVEVVTDWTGEDHNGEPFFYYHYRCTLKRGDTVAGQGEGSCNSWEKKYRYRNVDARYATDEQKEQALGIEKTRWGQKYVLLNPNPADTVNTIAKMAQKRALVAATLIAVNASEFFTQDIEDMDFGVIEGEFVEDSAPQGQAQQPKKAPTPPAPQTPSDKILNSEASEFWSIALNAIPRYDHINAVKAAAKKLGYTALSGVPAERVKMFESIRDYAEMRDKGMPDQLAISVINGVITTKEAWEQVAREVASPADVEAINKDLFGDDVDTTPAGNNYDE